MKKIEASTTLSRTYILETVKDAGEFRDLYERILRKCVTGPDSEQHSYVVQRWDLDPKMVTVYFNGIPDSDFDSAIAFFGIAETMAVAPRIMLDGSDDARKELQKLQKLLAEFAADRLV
jgi:hypothetical protein